MIYVETQGELSLKLVNNTYVVEALSGDVLLARQNGVAFAVSDIYEFTHAEPTPDGGFVAVMKFSNGDVSLRWFDANGTLVNWTATAAADAYLARESELNLDINGDGTVEPATVPEQVVESEGAATLKIVDGAYAVNDGSEDIALARANGVAFTVADSYEFTHAESTPDGGFVAVMKFSNGNVSLRWFDANGTLVNWTATAAADTYLARESELNLDINGDGTVEPATVPEQVVESEGAATLKIVDGAYAVNGGSEDIALARANGVAFTVADSYEFTHAESTPDGGFVAVMKFSNGNVSLRWFDANGTLVNWTATAAADTYLARESELNLDINGDGTVEPATVPEQVVESEGAATLKIVDGAYAVNGGSEDIALARANGVAFTVADSYEFTHAESTPDGGFVAVMKFSNGDVSLRWFDANGTLVNWTATAAADTYLARESELNLDINGDGTVEPATVPEQVVESEGAATLKIVDGAYAVNDGSEDIALARANGVAFTVADSYEFTHAESTPDGGFVAVMKFSNGDVSLRWFDANGTLVNWTATAAADTYLARESELNLDINGDGTVEPATVPEQVVESEGAATLKIVDGAYAVNGGSEDIALARANGVAFTVADSYEFTHAESTPDGGFVAVMKFSNGDVSLRWFDANGTLANWTANADVSTYIEREAELNIDLNGDGILSAPVETISTAGGISLVQEGDSFAFITDIASTTLLDGYGNPLSASAITPARMFVLQDEYSADPYLAVITEDIDSGAAIVFLYDLDGNFLDRTSKMQPEMLKAFELLEDVDFDGDGVIGLGADGSVTVNKYGHYEEELEVVGSNGADQIITDELLKGADWADVWAGAGDDLVVSDNPYDDVMVIGGAGNDIILGSSAYDEWDDFGTGAAYDSRGNGTTSSLSVRQEDAYNYIVSDSTGDLYHVTWKGKASWVEDLSLADGLDEGKDSLFDVNELAFVNDYGEIRLYRDPATGEIRAEGGAEYSIDTDGLWYGEINGTDAGDTIDTTQLSEFANLDPYGQIEITAGAGNDVITGGMESNWINAGRGNDTIDGGGISPADGHDRLSYDLFGTSGDPETLNYRKNTDGSLTVFDSSGDLLQVTLNADGSGQVVGLGEFGSRYGTDTFTNIEYIEIDGNFAYLEISNWDGEYEVEGTNVVSAFTYDWSEGIQGEISGSLGDDVLSVSDYSMFDTAGDPMPVGLWGGKGNDTLNGHEGSNWMNGGLGNDTLNGNAGNDWLEGDLGNDVLNGGAGFDTASYEVENWEGWGGLDQFDAYGNYIGVQEFNVRDNGDGNLTVYVNNQDLYRVSLDASGNGTVEDLWSADGDTGIDTLTGIESINISIPEGYMNISFDAELGYQVNGVIADEPYADGWGDGGGTIFGSTKDDNLDAAAFAEVDATNANVDIHFAASAGNDVMTGHVGYNTFSTADGDGDDTMNGGDGYDSVYYYSNWGAFDQFTASGYWQAGVRENAAGDYTVYVDGTELYSVVFDANNNATVTDLWLEDGNTGVDHLNSIENIHFDIPGGYASFSLYEGTVSYYYEDGQLDVADNGDGSFNIIGTDWNDDMAVGDFVSVIDTSAASSITLEGGYGDDILQGHEGTNYLIGGDGNDVLDGLGGDDTAVYRSYYWGDTAGAPQVSVQVAGATVTIGTADLGELYRVNLADQVTLDAVGDSPENASTGLTVGNAVSSSFETMYDTDTYAVAVEAGQTYAIRGSGDYTNEAGIEPWVTNITDGFGGTNGDWYSSLDDRGEYIEYTPYESGTVYVSVQSSQSMEGDYTLEVLPQGVAAPTETVNLPSEYINAITVEDIGWDEIWEGQDAVINTEHLEFNIDNNGTGEATVSIDQTDTGYDIVVNGVKQDEVSLVA